jgi:hypothetical protein
MKNYIIAWLVTILLTIGGLFGVGFTIGIIMAITGNVQDTQNLEQFAWFNILVLISMIVLNFLSFKFATKKFLVDK